MRKEENTIKTKKNIKKKKNNMKKILLMCLVLSFTACSSVNDKLNLKKPNIGKCPPQSERTLADMLCKETK